MPIDIPTDAEVIFWTVAVIVAWAGLAAFMIIGKIRGWGDYE